MITDQLRKAIVSSGKSCYAISHAAQIRPEVITRFLKGKRDLRFETVAKIAKVLGLSFRHRAKPKASNRGRLPAMPVGG